MALVLLKYPGVTGDSLLQDYPDWMVCDSYQLKTTRPRDDWEDEEEEEKKSTDSSGAVKDKDGSEKDSPKSNKTTGVGTEKKKRPRKHLKPISNGQSGDGVSGILQPREAYGIECITLSRQVDVASPLLMKMAFSATAGAKDKQVTAELAIFIPDTDSTSTATDSSEIAVYQVPILYLEMINSRIIRYDVDIDQEAMTEDIEIAFDTVNVTFTKIINGVVKGQVPATVSTVPE
jgi:type VI protein secretion system component Hcp